MSIPRIYTLQFSQVYPLYIQKVARKNRTKAELDSLIQWLFGYSSADIENIRNTQTDFAAFVQNAPNSNPDRFKITGTICGIRVETIDDPTTRDIRYLDKVVDELAKGKPVEKIMRS